MATRHTQKLFDWPCALYWSILPGKSQQRKTCAVCDVYNTAAALCTVAVVLAIVICVLRLMARLVLPYDVDLAAGATLTASNLPVEP